MKIVIAILAVVAVALTPSLATFPIDQTQTQAQAQAQSGNNSNSGTNESSFATLRTAQNPDHIVILVSRNGAPPIDKPIVVIPPTHENENGTVIVPGENNTLPGNNENITIIEPGGNITQVPSGNITNEGNVTVIAPPDQNVTETPGNVTVVDPPAHPEHPIVVPPQNCTCQQKNETIIVKPNPGQNTTISNEPPRATQLPSNTERPQQLPVFPPMTAKPNETKQ